MRNQQVTLVCQVCEKQFSVRFYRKEIAKFCSRLCMGKWNSLHRIGENAPAWKCGLTQDNHGYPQFSAGPNVKRRLHRVRAEIALGKPLPKGVVVHHPNEDKWNQNAQLVICQDQSYHLYLHKLMRERDKIMNSGKVGG